MHFLLNLLDFIILMSFFWFDCRIILKELDETQEKKKRNVKNEKYAETKKILGSYFTRKNKNKSLYL